MKTPEETVTFHCLTEYNDWEGETWYHYFLDEPGVLDVLDHLMVQDEEYDYYTELETCTLTWSEAERLTNRGNDGYMQEHWFGQLTNLEGLKQANSKTLYKGGIRDFGEELFSYDESESEDENEETVNE